MSYLDQNSRFSLFAKSRRAADRRAPDSNSEHASTNPADSARRDLMDEIGRFLLLHQLDITPENLAISHAAASGSNVVLTGKIAARQIRGEPVTQQWLATVVSATETAAAEHQKLDIMMDQLEQTIRGFAATTETACNQTGEYRSEMRQHVSDAERQISITDPQQFLQITQAMLGTLQRIETTMQQSQAETMELRANLQKARSEANLDHLTGLPNRRAFERHYAILQADAAAQNSGLFVAICDVDHFKRVNDNFGHETGDRLLRAIAGILNDYASTDCFVARHGGEEFAVLIRCGEMSDALDRLDRARRELEGRKFVARQLNKPVGKVTFSAGLANVMTSANPREALARADEALYRAKNEGRNRIVAA